MKKESSRWSEADLTAYLSRQSKAANKTNDQAEGGIAAPPSTRFFRVNVPDPLPVTRVYVNLKSGGRTLSEVARGWKYNTVCLIKVAATRQGWYYEEGRRLYRHIVWHFATDQSDIDNPIKILQDACAEALLFNDKVIDDGDESRGETCPESPYAEVEIGYIDEAYRTRRELQAERDRLRDAIIKHRAQKADDRCIFDDDVLYEAVGDGTRCDRRVGDKQAMLVNCARFIERRCESGGWPTYVELEERLRKLTEYCYAELPPSSHDWVREIVGEGK